MTAGALGCRHCNRKFRFEDQEEVEGVSRDLLRGGTASASIYRELQCYHMDKQNYPFKRRRTNGYN